MRNTKKSPSIAVIGAGPAGITSAYELSKAGVLVDVYEAGKTVGGLSKSIELWGQTVDIGPHRFFSMDDRVNSLWIEIVKQDYTMVNRLTRIYYRKKFFQYPLQPFNALANLGMWESVRCIISYALRQNSGKGLQKTFEEWVISRFGKRLFEIFFKTYSEKLWGISCQELDADFAAQRIKKLSLYEAIINAFGLSKVRHKTLVDQFAYPHGGTGMVYERMAEAVRKMGGRIFLGEAVSGIYPDEHCIGLELESGERRNYDHLISTMPLTLLVSSIPEVPEEIMESVNALEFRNTIIVYLQLAGPNPFPDNWIYVHAPEVKTGRITNFTNWVPQIRNGRTEHIIAMEYWCNSDDELWGASDDLLSNLAKEDLRQTGLASIEDVAASFVYRINRCYPIYRRGYREHVAKIRDYLARYKRLQVIGRYGSFKYNNQDHSILMGILAAQNIVDEAGHNLWDVNTDYDNYQEQSAITATGLVKTSDQ